ncbi:MAG: hypothetical protein R3Y24_10605, partial [Eubacteriales bacterium]
LPDSIQKQLHSFAICKDTSLSSLFKVLREWCELSAAPIVLIIDEVDSATNNQVFLDFLSQLRFFYLQRQKNDTLTFHSVILAGVYDIKNITLKNHHNKPIKTNSPWNIAADFNITMSFSVNDIYYMLQDYENDYSTGMDITSIAQAIYAYTSGYPYLVSRICKLIDETISKKMMSKTLAWTNDGFLQAIHLLINEKNTLFSSLINKLQNFVEVRKLVTLLLMQGQSITYTATNEAIEIAYMFGFIKEEYMMVTISNRIFETVFYNHLLSSELLGNELYANSLQNKNQFVENGQLNMELILSKFVQSFTDIYGQNTDSFVEEQGRKYFLLFLKPIINGTGNYYIEAQTRDMRRTDIIVDYLGKQYIIEMKIWHGEEYNKRGEQQLSEYLDYYRLEKGYMLSFNFNKSKNIGIQHMMIHGKELIEAVV